MKSNQTILAAKVLQLLEDFGRVILIQNVTLQNLMTFSWFFENLQAISKIKNYSEMFVICQKIQPTRLDRINPKKVIERPSSLETLRKNTFLKTNENCGVSIILGSSPSMVTAKRGPGVYYCLLFAGKDLGKSHKKDIFIRKN